MWQRIGRAGSGGGIGGNWTFGRLASGLVLLGALLLSGCASTVVTDVTAFRQPGWQNDAPRTYSFEHSTAQAALLDRQTYEQWLASTLAGLGFEQVPAKQARYRVSMEYDSAPGIVRVAETVYPGDPWYGPWGPYGPYGPYGFYQPWGPWGWGPGYWPPQTVVRDVPVTFASLRVYFKDAATGQRVYQVTAQNQSEGGNVAAMMPYLIRSAFTDFPAESGRPRRVTLTVDKDAK
jgi:hypothetical protein